MKVTEQHLRALIRESLLLEFEMNPIKWFKDKAGKEFDEAKFRVWWEKELLTNMGAIDPRTERRLQNFDISDKRGERVAAAWAKVGAEKFAKAFKELEGNQYNYLMGQLGFIATGNAAADPDALSGQIDDLFDPESELYQKTENTTMKKLKGLWSKWFGDDPEEAEEGEGSEEGEEGEESDEDKEKVKEGKKMKVTRRQLRRIIREYAEALPGIAVPGWPEKHFAWRDVVFTKDGDVRYINDIADPETVSAANSIGEPFPPGTNVVYIRGAFNPDGIPGQRGNSEKVHVHDSELLAIIDAEGWHQRPPPEGAISGFWDGRGQWSEDLDPDDHSWDLPPEEEMEEPILETLARIRGN